MFIHNIFNQKFESIYEPTYKKLTLAISRFTIFDK